MEMDSGSVQYRAIILSKPELRSNGKTVRFRTRFHGRTRAFMAESDDLNLLNLCRGDEVYVDAYGEGTGTIISHNRFMRWFVQLWY